MLTFSSAHKKHKLDRSKKRLQNKQEPVNEQRGWDIKQWHTNYRDVLDYC